LSQSICKRYQIVKYPTYIIFKSTTFIYGSLPNSEMAETYYEIHYGGSQQRQITIDDLVSFVKENAFTPVHTITQYDKISLKDRINNNLKKGYLIDFFAPWCPPCMNLLPEFRKSSSFAISQNNVNVATVDCAANSALCQEFNIHSYPSTILFNGTEPHSFHGNHLAQDIIDFIEDILSPSVIVLTHQSFIDNVAKNPSGKIWLIDFYAKWCGPCQQMAPQWRKLAKLVDKDKMQVAMVDCVVEPELCANQRVNQYPNIRLYPKGASKFEQYQGWNRDAQSFLQWASNYLPQKSIRLDRAAFEKFVIKNSDKSIAWVVDFFTPWCGFCQTFSPTFEVVATKLDGKIKFGKVNCQEEPNLCQLAGISQYPTIRFYSPSNSKQMVNIFNVF
jgi:DnaJ homolog subfamily C member 10